jgi:hypothetical protein
MSWKTCLWPRCLDRADWERLSAKIAPENGLIIVGDVSPSKIAKTRMGKSSLDAGWADFKTMLS